MSFITTQKFMTATELNEKLISLVKNERKITQEILSHILLFQKCNGYLKLGYSSLHQYLTRGLGYSDDQAYRRIKASQLLNQIPEVADKLESAKINLSQMAAAQKAFEISERETKTPITQNTKTILLAALENATNFQTKSILSTELNLKPKIEEKCKPQSDNTVRMEFNLTTEQFEKLQKIKSIISHQIPDLNTAAVLEVVFDFFISKKQPVSIVPTHSKSRITAEKEKVFETETESIVTRSFMETKKQSAKINSKVSQNKDQKKRNRYISVKVKKELYKKSQGCCEYVGPTGIRCGSRYKIQIDHHQKAFCFGGDNMLENLRHLCAQHNLMTAREAGIGFETTSGWRL